jgi:hypothetical protein
MYEKEHVLKYLMMGQSRQKEKHVEIIIYN